MLQSPCQERAIPTNQASNPGETPSSSENISPTRSGWSVSLRSSIIAVLAGITLLLSPHNPSLAQESAETPSDAAPARPMTAPPSPAECMAAYTAADSWVRSWGYPPLAKAIDPENTTAVSVTLRLDGEVLIQLVVSEAKPGELTYTAMKQALDKADPLLPIPYSHDRIDLARRVAQRITLEIEFAGALIPLMGDTFENVALSIAPQREGVAIRSGRSLAHAFPSEQRLRNAGPASSFRTILGKLELPPTRLGQLRASHAVTPYRFSVTHIAQPDARAPAVFMHRGGRIVSMSQVNTDSIKSTAAGIVDHLILRLWPGEEPYGLLGTYEIVTAEHFPLIGTPREQAIAAYTLARYATAQAVDDETRQTRAFEAAQRIIRELAQVEPDEDDPLADPVSAAAWLLGAREAGLASPDESRDPELAGFAERARTVLRETHLSLERWPRDSPSEGRSLVALAIAEEARAVMSDEGMERAREAVRTIFRETPPGDLVAHMPWLGLAELAVAELDAPIPSYIALLRMRELLWEFQLTEQDTGLVDRDLAGGIVFTRGRNPLPSWHMLRPLCFVAVMLGDERMTEFGEYTTELASITKSLRFLMQLTVREGELHLAKEGNRARGGVRTALWDHRLTLDTQSLALMTLTETLRSIEQRGRPAAVPQERPVPQPIPTPSTPQGE